MIDEIDLCKSFFIKFILLNFHALYKTFFAMKFCLLSLFLIKKTDFNTLQLQLRNLII